MTAFPETYQILLNYGPRLGLAFAEAVPGDSFDKAVQDIIDGFTGDTRVIAVYRTGLDVVTKDVSDLVCEAIVERHRKGERLSDTAEQFVWDEGGEIEQDYEPDPDDMRDQRDEYIRIGLT